MVVSIYRKFFIPSIICMGRNSPDNETTKFKAMFRYQCNPLLPLTLLSQKSWLICPLIHMMKGLIRAEHKLWGYLVLLDCFINTMKEMVLTFVVQSPWYRGSRGSGHSSVKFHASVNELNPSVWQVNLAEILLNCCTLS